MLNVLLKTGGGKPLKRANNLPFIILLWWSWSNWNSHDSKEFSLLFMPLSISPQINFPPQFPNQVKKKKKENLLGIFFYRCLILTGFHYTRFLGLKYSCAWMLKRKIPFCDYRQQNLPERNWIWLSSQQWDALSGWRKAVVKGEERSVF